MPFGRDVDFVSDVRFAREERNTSHHFAPQAQYITVRQHNITAAKPQLHFFASKVFQNFIDAFPRSAHLFGFVDRFEPTKCIF